MGESTAPPLAVRTSIDICPEIEARILAYNNSVHDWETIDGRSFLVNHFIALGLEVAEKELAAAGEELF